MELFFLTLNPWQSSDLVLACRQVLLHTYPSTVPSPRGRPPGLVALSLHFPSLPPALLEINAAKIVVLLPLVYNGMICPVSLATNLGEK